MTTRSRNSFGAFINGPLCFLFIFFYFQGSIKCKARAITCIDADGMENLIHRSYEHNHVPKDMEKTMMKKNSKTK